MSAAYDANLTVSGLTKIYPNAGGHGGGGIRPVDFDLAPGTFFTLLGPSGCGKTTTLRCLAGLEQPDQGVIRLGSTEFFNSGNGANVPLNERNIGMVFQSYAIWPHMTVFENVAFPLRVANDRKYSSAEIKKAVMEALETVDMAPFAQRSSTQLSGGQQQRVALARAIARKPRLLLLDEPLSNLDARLRDDMRVELKRLQRQLGITTIYVTHDQSEALDMSDQIAVINLGHLVQLGTPHEIYFSPRDAFVASFLGSVNLLSGTLSQPAQQGGQAKVKLDIGGEIPAAVPHSLSSGAVSVSLRPEAISIRKRTETAAEGSNSFDGVVTGFGFLGFANRYTVEVAGQPIQIATPASVSFDVGTEVAIDIAISDTLALQQREGSAQSAAA
jgi:iron(III) transport system ATP-binding protein